MNQATCIGTTSAATEVLALASDIAGSIQKVSELFIQKFDKVMQPESPQPSGVALPTRQYPLYFDDMRSKLKIIQNHVENIEEGIRRAEL